MTDPLIKHLNKRLADTINRVNPANQENLPGSVSQFDQVLSQKQNMAVYEKLAETIMGDQPVRNQMQVLDAKNIDVEFSAGEFARSSTFEGKKALFDLFATINNDALKMDSIVEVLSSDNIKLSRRQLLAYQASIGSLTINTELFSRLAQSISQNINTVLQTNMG